MEPVKYYAYFFTRQDISAEQQIVQTAHVALKLGVNATSRDNAKEAIIPGVPHRKTINPDETYFTVVGVRNVDALNACIEILDKFGFAYEVFYEPDIGNEPTSIAVYPVAEYNRGPLLAFNLLKVK